MDELENQLHKQLAENDNNRIGSFVSFIGSIVALFGFYGFVYVNTYKREWNFGTEEFLLIAFVTIGILFFLAILSLHLGYSFRRDHLIVHKIRIKHYKKDTEEETKKNMEIIFGNLYSPLEKKCCNFLPDFYNMFYWLFNISQLFLFIITIKKVICNIISNCNCNDIIYFLLFLAFSILFIILTLVIRYCYFKKYKKEANHCKEQINNGIR